MHVHVYIYACMYSYKIDTYTMDEHTYLELKPRRINLLHTFRILSSADIEECQDFIESVNENQASFEGRWMVFLSVFVQKLLQYNKKPLSLLGSTSEMCLNIFGNSTNFKLFFINLLRGKVEVPRSNFLSIIGLLDTRVELDNSIKPGNSKYFPTLCAMASKLAYENDDFIKLTVENTWKMELLGTYSFWDERYNGNTTQAFMFRDNNINPGTIIVAFRGTEPFNADDWITDFDISWCKLKGMEGRVHGGFLKALGLNQARVWPVNVRPGAGRNAYDTITHDLSSHVQTRFVVTGHSLGGALALLYSAVLAMHNEIRLLEKLEAVYTFGQPKVGDERFGRFMEEKFRVYGVRYLRFVYSHDVVPTLPIDNSALMFKHFGTCIYFNTIYEPKIVKEEKVKKCLECCSSIVSNRVDAVWELVRSFLLPGMFGPDYREGLLLKMFRLVGLLCPGLTAHGLQDYVNATRLATY